MLTKLRRRVTSGRISDEGLQNPARQSDANALSTVFCSLTCSAFGKLPGSSRWRA